MTTAELIAYYVNLLILQYKGKPKAEGTIAAYADAILIDQLPLDIQDAFDVNTATGYQLDILGKYAGVERTGFTFSQAVTLDDDDYRKLVKLKVILNNTSSSLADIQSVLALYFAGQIQVFDFRDMTMGYYLNSSVGSQNLVEIFINKGLLPRPMAVGLAGTIYFPTLEFFGFRTYPKEGVNNYPFNTYDDYNETWPWLTYAYAIDATTTVDMMLLTQDGQDTLVQQDGDALLI